MVYQLEKLESIIFYSIEKAIKSYRQLAQKQIKKAGLSITIDQWLVIKNILEKPGITQSEIAERSFKDNASVTRIIELLVKSEYLERKFNIKDRRRYTLIVTENGQKVMEDVMKVVYKNRATALNGVTSKELEQTSLVLKKISKNCINS